jgi:uncharacterized alpha-E superfamily protein
LADILLARNAETIFWLARYIERAENLARILDVNASFARDRQGTQDWLPVLQLNADEARFAAAHGAPTVDSVLRFYLTDRANPTSIVSAIGAARENARALRPLISTEMWAHLNVFHRWLRELEPTALSPGNLTRLLNRIKEACQAHTGITDGTLHRDQASYFYRLGRFIERADQTTRLIDIKYHALLPSPADVGSRIDIGQWDVVLRSAAAHHAYLRVVPGGVTPAGVAGFLLLHPHFPRAVAFCVGEADRLLGVLRDRHALPGSAVAAEGLRTLRTSLAALPIEEVIARGLHEFLDQVQRRLIAATNDISKAFFETATQSQVQG